MKSFQKFSLLFILLFNFNALFAESEIQLRFKNSPGSPKLTIKGIKVFYQATKPAFNPYARLTCENFGMGGWSFKKMNAFILAKDETIKIPNEMNECNFQITDMVLLFNFEGSNLKNSISVSLYPTYDTPFNIDLFCSKNTLNKFECLDNEGNDSLNIPINKKSVNITIKVSNL